MHGDGDGGGFGAGIDFHHHHDVDVDGECSVGEVEGGPGNLAMGEIVLLMLVFLVFVAAFGIMWAVIH